MRISHYENISIIFSIDICAQCNFFRNSCNTIVDGLHIFYFNLDAIYMKIHKHIIRTDNMIFPLFSI